MELASVASVVVGSGTLDTRAPERALVVGDTCRHWAVVGGVQRRVTLDEEVEAGAESGVVAPLGTAERVVAVESDEPQVGVRTDTGILVLECLGVPGRRLRLLGIMRPDLICLECLNSVGCRYWSVA